VSDRSCSKRLAILGGAGFIGRHLAVAARATGAEVVVFDRAVSAGEEGMRRIEVEDLRPADVSGFDRIYHLAGALGTAETFDSLEETLRTNVLGTVAVLRAALAVSTPVTYVTLGNDWLNPYTISKNAAARLCEMFRSEHGLPTQVVVTYNLYGPFQKAVPVRKIVPAILNRLLCGEPVEVHGDGDQIVDLVYAPDFARELLADDASGSIHIGTGVPRRVVDVVGLCAQALGIARYEVRHVRARRGEPPHSVSLAPHGYRHIQGTPLEDGLAATARWYRDQPPGSPYRRAAP
jgi:UDP-glucose 4-epimerase